MNELIMLAAALLNLAATSDVLPGLYADIDTDIEDDGTSAWFRARTESGAYVQVTIAPADTASDGVWCGSCGSNDIKNGARS